MNSRKPIKSAEIHDGCFQTVICQHRITITYQDNTTEEIGAFSSDIRKNYARFLSPEQRGHFGVSKADCERDRELSEKILPTPTNTFFKPGEALASKTTAQMTNGYIEATQQYINSFAGEEKYSEAITKLNLTSGEEELFSGCVDPVYLTVMDIPVRYKNAVYDLSTLLKMPETDACGKLLFSLSEISPASDVAQTIKANINRVKQQRAEQDTVRSSMRP
jgi:hypothetical protein